MSDGGRNTSLAEAVTEIVKFAPLLADQMMAPAVPENEADRLAALEKLDLLDREREPVFDRITAKLIRLFEVPIALISLIDRERQFFMSEAGLPPELASARQVSRDLSVCGHVVADNETLVVEDLARDRRFANNPFIKERGFRFYAGVPLHSPEGFPIGSLCILDFKPRQLSEREKRILQEYGKEVTDEIASRSKARELVSAS